MVVGLSMLTEACRVSILGHSSSVEDSEVRFFRV